jgi:hypothetical protein
LPEKGKERNLLENIGVSGRMALKYRVIQKEVYTFKNLFYKYY